MSKYTAQLRTIIDNDVDIFDFEYTRSAEAQAIVSDDDLETGFINHFYFREVGFETLERFLHYLKTKWLEEIQIFDKLLIAYNKEINVLSNSKSNTSQRQIFNDEPLNNVDVSENNATTITDTQQEQTSYNGISEIELLELYHDKIKDIQTEFYTKFENLFMQIF